MTRKIYICALLVLGIGAAFAGELRKSLDYAVFHSSEQPIVELYYSIYTSDLTFEQEGDDYNAYFLGQLEVLKNDTTFKSYAWKNVQTVNSSSSVQDTDALVDQITLSLPVGEYDAKFMLQDLNTGLPADTTEFNINVPASQETPFFSDIEFASSIRRAQPNENESPFYKNTLIVEPNPTLLYSEDLPMLFFYVEVYNVQTVSGEQPYQFVYAIHEKNGAPVSTMEAKSVERQNASSAMVEFGYLNVSDLPAGGYVLNLKLRVEDQVVAEKNRDFYVYQSTPVVAVEADDFNSSIFAAMDSTQINNEFDYLRYIVPKEEQGIVNEIGTLEEKRHYLFEFWKNNNPDVDASRNNMRLEYLRRIQHANQQFRAFKREGWTTDRGRVYILYGEPNEIDRYPSEPNRVPYVIWSYHNLQNGVRFIFAEVEGYNEYQLIHSDLYGEIQNYDYEQILRTGVY